MPESKVDQQGVSVMDRRHNRRVMCQATLLVQRSDDAAADFKEQVTADVSLGGILFKSDEKYKTGEELIVSVTIPDHYRREFPFSRLAGKARVIRVTDLSDDSKKYEIGLAFGRDITTLMAVPTQN